MNTRNQPFTVEPRRGFLPALAALLGLVLVTTGNHLQAQELLRVTQDSKVKITAPGMGLDGVVGMVQQVTPQGLVVRFDSVTGTVSVPRDRIADVDLVIGTRGHPFIGMFMGAALGGALGVLIPDHHKASSRMECSEYDSPLGYFYSGWECRRKESPARVTNRAGVGAALGGLAGLLIGSRVRTDVWHQADMSGPGLSIQPVLGLGHQGFVLSLSL
jgi:hypothetical protein